MSTKAFTEAQATVLSRYGIEAEERFVDVPTLRGQAHVLVSGHGPPLLLANGIGTPGAMLAPLMTHLDGFTSYAVDLPGYGLTDSTPDLSNDLVASAVSFFREVSDGLGLDRPVFVTNSLGSLWAMWFALEHPERVAALVHVGWPAIVLGTSAPMPMRLLSARPLGRLMMRIQPPSPAQVKQLSKMVHEHPLPPEIGELLLETERLPDFQPTFLTMLNRLLRLRGSRPELAMNAEQLSRVRAPSQLVVGDDDPFGGPADVERIRDALPSLRIDVVEGGHAPWLRNGERVGDLVNAFLSDQG